MGMVHCILKRRRRKFEAQKREKNPEAAALPRQTFSQPSSMQTAPPAITVVPNTTAMHIAQDRAHDQARNGTNFSRPWQAVGRGRAGESETRFGAVEGADTGLRPKS